MAILTRDKLKENNEREIRRAGARYTPILNPAAPNLEIESVLQAFGGLTVGAKLADMIGDLEEMVRQAWGRSSKRMRRAFERRVCTPERLAETLGALRGGEPGTLEEQRRKLERTARYVERRVWETVEEIREEIAELDEDDDSGARHLNSELSDALNVRRALGAVEQFIESPAYALMEENAMLLLGGGGTGKTHFMCDWTKRRMESGKPTLLLLAQHIPEKTDPKEAIPQGLGLEIGFEEVLARLQELGERSGERAVLLIDAINEGDRVAWRRGVGELAQIVRSHTHVGLALSCRRPFDQQIFTRSGRGKYVEVEHPGFAEIELDAQLEFFDYYKIPSPQLPLITPEFSNPLFLKLLCEAIENLSSRAQSKTLRDITSGQRGMTHVLEHYTRVVGGPIEEEFRVPRKTCWRVLKGHGGPEGEAVCIAAIMAAAPRDHVMEEEAKQAIESITGLSATEAEKFLRRMVTDGLLAEDLHWERDSEDFFEVLRFPYQRFGDHLVARYLLERYLNTETEEAIRRSFYINRPLGKIFELTHGGHSFAMPGLASAIMLEFPERVKRVLPEEERELVFYLPKERRLGTPLKDVFLEGLHWRSAISFTEQTDLLVGYFLKGNEWVRNETLEVLVSLATRLGHPYSASRLSSYLEDLEMPERDLFWSEYLRGADEHSPVYRLLDWVERNVDDGAIGEEAAKNSLQLLPLLLTTTDRPLRDRVTRAIFLIGLAYPETLFDFALACLEFNDPYLPERMLAACYGVAMSHWADPDGKGTRDALPNFARSIVDVMFLPTAPYGTRHVLTRDYALGVVTLARKVSPGCIASKKVKYIKEPFDHIPNPFAHSDGISDEDVESAEAALHMDFNNYTLGRLIPGRRNYDFEHEEYKIVRKKILHRIKELGFSSDRFEKVDRLIADQAWRVRNQDGKTDRYGKKYSWVAYFEMHGVRLDSGELDDWRKNSRTSDCDIDPSFPMEPRKWSPPLPNPFKDPYESPVSWIQEGSRPSYDHLLRFEVIEEIPGPWVLLNGFIEQDSDQDVRQVFTFLRGLFLRRQDVPKFRQAVAASEYPGNQRIPEPYSDHYTYAGEIPWSPQFGEGLRGYRDSALRNLQRAFERFESGERVGGIRTEVPVHKFSWESTHSTLNQVGGVTVPAPALCERLGLVNHRQTFDLFDENGDPAALYREFKVASYFSSDLLFIREDLLHRYLEGTKQELIWILWGERTFQSSAFRQSRDKIEDALTQHYQIHSKVLEYDSSIHS